MRQPFPQRLGLLRRRLVFGPDGVELFAQPTTRRLRGDQLVPQAARLLLDGPQPGRLFLALLPQRPAMLGRRFMLDPDGVELFRETAVRRLGGGPFVLQPRGPFLGGPQPNRRLFRLRH